MTKTVKPSKKLRGSVYIPGDKSVSHRSLIFGALAEGETEVTGLLKSDDVLSTKSCLEQMGVVIREQDGKYFVQGRGLRGLQAPAGPLDCGNSGTTIRLLLGVLAGQDFSAQMTGDASLRSRPMRRVTAPLEQMGARFELTEGNFAPLRVYGRPNLNPVDYELPVASAQVKSALLLAALLAQGQSCLRGKIQSRDHTERMLQFMGAKLIQNKECIFIDGGQQLTAQKIQVPSDPSTAAFWAAGASLVRDADVELENILLNPTRTGLFEVLRKMGAEIQTDVTSQNPEPMGKLRIRSSELRAVEVDEELIPSLIDEIPLIAILATQAEGVTRVRGAAELRVKESDRISAVVKNLTALGVEIEEFEDGFSVEGPQLIQGGQIESFHDHRIAMAFSIAGLIAQGPVQIRGAEAVSVSYPHFYDDLEKLIQ